MTARQWDLPWVVLAMVFPSAAAWLYFRTFGGASWMPLLYAAAKVLQFSLPAVAWFVAGPGSWHPGRRPGMAWTGLATGMGMGLAVWAAWALGLRSSGLAAAAGPRVTARLDAIGVAGAGGFILLAAFLSLLHSLLEEYYWRWFVHGRLRGRLGPAAATLSSSLAFAAHHVIVVHAFTASVGWTLALSACVAAAGVVWARVYERSGSVVPAWISHALVDAAVLAVGYRLAA